MIITRRIVATLIFLIVYLPQAHAFYLPENHSVNGGVTIIPISLKNKPVAFYGDNQVAVVESSQKDHWLLVVGIPLNETKSIQDLILTKPNKARVPFHVTEKKYPVQRLVIKNERKVNPLAEDEKRIANETKRLEKIFKNYTKNNPFKNQYKAPSHGPITSIFGMQRVYNNEPRPPHTGLDVASPDKSPVRSTNDGVVVDAHKYFFTGNTVVVDHGSGVFSLYAHLNKMNVKPGQEVKRGDIVGTIGQTGRVTGPHLHWSMVMNQTYVDPLLFVSPAEVRKVEVKDKPKS